MTQDIAPERIWVALSQRHGLRTTDVKPQSNVMDECGYREYALTPTTGEREAAYKPTREQVEDAICEGVDEGTFEWGTNGDAVIDVMVNAVMALIDTPTPPETQEVMASTNAETRWIEDAKNSCPHCGGSGHKDDVKEPEHTVQEAARTQAGPHHSSRPRLQQTHQTTGPNNDAC